MSSTAHTLVNFFYELGMLKKIKHCGVMFAGVLNPDTLGEHSCRSGQIGFMLACETKDASPERVSLLCLMHDIGEIRVGDAHRIAERYVEVKPGERTAMMEQTEPLPPAIRTHIRSLWDEFHDQKTLNARLARDADLLETMMQAKEYLDCGYKAAQRWLDNGKKLLQTPIAKKMFTEMCKTPFTDWWNHLNR